MTDHKSLKELISQRIHMQEQEVYLANILGYDYIILYKVGSHYLVVDVLSRAHKVSTKGFWLLNAPQFKFL